MRSSLLAVWFACAITLLWSGAASAGLSCQSAVECDDGDECTHNLCINGACSNPDRAFGTICTDDGNQCTRDACLPDGTGGLTCQHEPRAFGSPCNDDGDECTFDRCVPGFEGRLACAHEPVPFGSPCNDEGNSCTTDRCVPGSNGPLICAHEPLPFGSPCGSDENSCTQDICAPGTIGIACIHNPLQFGSPCDDDANQCTRDVCAPLPSGVVSCSHQPLQAGTTCSDDSSCTQYDQCDPNGLCVGNTPVLDCRTAAKASIMIKNNAINSRDLVDFKWMKGADTELFEFGDPLTTTDYTLCVFDGDGRLRLSADVPAGGQCGDVACWKAAGKGYQYADKLRLSDGIAKLRMSAGKDQKSTVQVRGQGRFLPVPGLPLAAGAGSRVQVINDETGVCFQAVFGAAKANTEKKFQAQIP
ncbi:MAG: hypothetical protein ACRERC_18060 [Candidatus Binatia bacterium]